MKFSEVVSQTLAWLQREGRVSYRALRLEFDLNEDVLDALKEEIIEVKEAAVDKDGKNAGLDGRRTEGRKGERGKRRNGKGSPKLSALSYQLSVLNP